MQATWFFFISEENNICRRYRIFSTEMAFYQFFKIYFRLWSFGDLIKAMDYLSRKGLYISPYFSPKKPVDTILKIHALRFQNGHVGKSWTHLLPWMQQIYNYIWNNSLGKGPENWMNKVSITKGKRAASKQGGETEIQSCQGKKHNPSHGDTQSGRITKIRLFFLRTEGLNFTSGTPDLKVCTGEINPQNTWLWKPTRNISKKTIEKQRMENLIVKHSTRELNPKTNTKTPDCKAHGPQVRGTTY